MRFLLILFSILYTITFQAQHNWQRTNPGGGGAIAVVGATVDGTILTASDLSGIYRSNDNGQSWDVVGATQGLDETHVSSFGFDPNDGDTFFAGTYRGLYKTTDGGNSFTFVFPTEEDEYSYIEDIAISASNSNIGFVTHHPGPETSGVVYKTTDGGDTWGPIEDSNFPDDVHIVKLMVHPSTDQVVYALSGKSRWGCGDAVLYRSFNGGTTWFQIANFVGDILDFDLHPTDPSIVFVSTFDSNYEDNQQCIDLGFEDYVSADENQGELYKSTNSGNTFEQIGEYSGIISVGIDDPDIIRVVDVLYPFDWNDNAGTWETTDGGETWSHTGLIENWNSGYVPNQYYAYTLSFNGINKTVTKDIFNSDRFYGSFGQWSWGSFDGGVTMSNISTQEVTDGKWLSTGMENINGHAIVVNESNPNIVYMGGYDIGFWYSINNGDSWERTQPDYNIYPEYSWSLGDGVVEDHEAKFGAGGNVMNILSDPTRENVVWATFSFGQYSDPSEGTLAKTGLFKSTNNGEDWELLSEGLPDFDDMLLVYGLSLAYSSPENSRALFITVNGNVYSSNNDGASWRLSLENGALKFTEVDKFDSNIVYACGKDGLWRSLDGGASWEDIGIPEMHSFHANTRPDIVPTWIDWSTDPETYPFEGGFDIKSDPNNPNRVYLAVIGPNKGLYKSNDAGDTWANILVESEIRGVAIMPYNSDIIYVSASQAYHSGGFGNSTGILFSYDAGETWEDANDGMAYKYGGRITVGSGSFSNVWAWSPGTGVQKAHVPFEDSVGEINIEDLLSIYPNPTKNSLTIDLSKKEKIEAIEIYSSNGKLVYSNNNVPNRLSIEIDVENFATGVYSVNVITKSGLLTQTFVKK